MNLNELTDLLRSYNVPDRWYSLNSDKLNSCIVYKKGGIWEYYHLDEKGNKTEYKVFGNNEDAYDHLWLKLKRQFDLFDMKKAD